MDRVRDILQFIGDPEEVCYVTQGQAFPGQQLLLIHSTNLNKKSPRLWK
jgi:hypothetical protein